MKHVVLPHRSIISTVRTTAAAASIGLIGGIGLQTVTDELLVITPLLLALPAINAMAGDYATVITAHLGDPETSAGDIRKLYKAMVLGVPIGAAGVIGLSLLLAYIQGYGIEASFVRTYSVFVFVSLTSVVIITALTSFLLNWFLAQKQLNSDDVLIPVSNVLASVLILLSVAIAAWRIF